MAPRRWAANICATWPGSCKARAPRPAIPENYFDRVTENALQALARPGGEDLADYNDVVMAAVPLQSWRSHALKLFANWLAAIAAEKTRRPQRRPGPGRNPPRAPSASQPVPGPFRRFRKLAPMLRKLSQLLNVITAAPFTPLHALH